MRAQLDTELLAYDHFLAEARGELATAKKALAESALLADAADLARSEKIKADVRRSFLNAAVCLRTLKRHGT